MIEGRRLVMANFWVAVVAFGLAAIMAVMQALARADAELAIRSTKIYYVSVTAHGVLMALVFTTFFIMALGYFSLGAALKRVDTTTWGWISFLVSLVGTILATLAILSGSSTVLYTFYPPLKAHPLFYVGATLLVVGSWIWCWVMIRTYLVWRSKNRDEAVPLAVHGMVVTVVIWILATAGLAVEVVGMLLPWSFGLVDKVDPIVARTFFWWFGHPLTYFWLVPAYVVWYTIIPEAIGGRLFSDRLTRVVFILFVLFSTPVGFHHQFSDPGITSGWKLLHTVTTYAILFPSFVTAFSVIASFEVAGRLKGATGLFDWIAVLPWKDPFFASVALAMVTFAIGGFGGAINAAYAMNTMVKNTSWIQGHFHLTVGTAVALTFMGFSYWMLPRLTGYPVRLRALALAQPYTWFVGMMLFSITSHITGIMGMPRRVYSAAFGGSEVAASWASLTVVSAIGGVVLFVSSALWLVVLIVSVLGEKRPERPAIEFARPLVPVSGSAGLWDRFGLWTAVAAVLILIAYAYPIAHLLALPRFASSAFQPF
ncbi:MAG TPA: cbb3-type cytochrome c oxidase subunit I [Vicinamibacteria bacterium]|nr:cbb3-type cytochrome c oxidase subunit I [Vicinamibacteria bacterium]